MSLNDWPYWIKGGLISLLVTSAITLILFIIQPSCSGISHCWWPLWGWVMLLPGLIFSVLLRPFTNNDLWDEFLKYGGILFVILFYFSIGALIGWIVGKIKSKKK